jgi:hypothetical protein
LIIGAICNGLAEGDHHASVILATTAGTDHVIEIMLTVPPTVPLRATVTGSSVQLRFWTARDKRYSLEVADSPDRLAPWRSTGAAVVGIGDLVTVALPFDVATPQRFYRVQRLLNDDFVNRIPIHTLPSLFFAHNSTATSEPSEPNPCDDCHLGRRTLWWSWKADVTGNVILSPNSPGIYLAAFTGSLLSDLILVAAAGHEGTSVTFLAQAGVTYEIMVQSFDRAR